MWPPEPPEPDFPEDVPPSEPLGSMPVIFSVPVPTIEQVAGQIARQIITSYGYSSDHYKLQKLAESQIISALDKLVSDKVTPVLEKVLETPFQPTDTFGNPKGEPVSLFALVANRLENWENQLVDSSGKPCDAGPRAKRRIDYLVESLLTSALQQAIKAKVDDVLKEMKKEGERVIAAQIASRLSGFLKL